LITKKEDAWITEFVPQYSPKGQRLHHRRASMTEKQRYLADFFDRLKEEEILTSETNDTITAMQDGFIVSFYEKDGKWKGLAYRKSLEGADINLESPYCPTRRDADIALTTYIRAYAKSLNK